VKVIIAILVLHVLHNMVYPTVGNTPIFLWVGGDNLSVAVKEEKGFGFLVIPIQKDYQAEGMVSQVIRAVIKAVNM